VEFVLTPAATADIVGFRKLDLNLPAGATVTADAAYTDYDYEDLLREQEQVDLLADRKCNSKRPHPAYLGYLCHQYRKRPVPQADRDDLQHGDRVAGSEAPRGHATRVGA